MNSKFKNEFLENLKGFLITISPFILGVYALFANSAIEHSNFRLLLIWLSLELSSIICVIRKEIPRLYPYKPLKGRLAESLSMTAVVFWSVIGIGILASRMVEAK